MNSSHPAKTAILIFANSAEEDVKHKPIPKGKKLFDALTKTTLKTVETAGLPYFHFTEKQQIGATFGERYSNAIQAIFNKGFDKVITIGNDSPKLKAHHINEAVKQLETNKVVLGPSLDGGFYLLGIQKANFNKEQFFHLPWQTNSIKKTLLALIVTNNNSKVSFLPYLSDIDSVEDIHYIFNFSFILPKQLRLLFLEIIKEFKIVINYYSLFFSSLKRSIYFNKGSPIF